MDVDAGLLDAMAAIITILIAYIGTHYGFMNRVRNLLVKARSALSFAKTLPITEDKRQIIKETEDLIAETEMALQDNRISVSELMAIYKELKELYAAISEMEDDE